MSRLVPALSLLLVHSPALACSVCFSATEANRWAYLATTIFLSLLPLAFIGGVAFWIWRLARARDEAAATS